MAYTEYLDLYKLAQNKKSLYYVVSFDVVNSKSLSNEKRQLLQENINVIVRYVYEKLVAKEKELNIDILIHDPRFKNPWDNVDNGNYMDPFIMGDNFQFTVLRNTISKEEIVNLVNECKKALNMQEEFHIASGYYETNEYEEGKTKLYRGYLLQILGNIHKPELKKELNKAKIINKTM